MLRRTMLRDFRLALRLAARRPLLSGAIVATLALGIGATTAMFGVARAVLARSAPFRDADRLAILWLSDPARSQSFVEVSYPDFLDWRLEASDAFESLSAMPAVNFEATLTGVGEPRRVRGRAVTANFFHVLGVAPALGRAFDPSEDRPTASRTIVLGHGLWQDLFGGDPAAVGKTLTLGGTLHTVVGIMPRALQYPAEAQYWIPLEPAVPEAAITGRNIGWLLVVGRLRDGVTLETARHDGRGRSPPRSEALERRGSPDRHREAGGADRRRNPAAAGRAFRRRPPSAARGLRQHRGTASDARH